jgi:spore maturation protein CgeB
LECYGSEEELLQKTEYYLTHEKDRKEIAHNGAQTVRKYHNYPKRLLDMLSLAFHLDRKA